MAERERLRHLEALRGARRRRRGGAGRRGRRRARAAALAEARAARWRPSRGVDAALDALADRAQALAVEADDLAGELRRYGEGVEAAPGRLDEVEERLALLDRLKRKHGGTIAAVLEHAEACRARRDELAGAEEALEAGEAELEAARAELASAPASCARRAARGRGSLAERGASSAWPALAMEGASFEARVAERDGYGPSGGDEVEFLIAPEPRRAGRPAARDRVRRRALARDARADGRRRRGRAGDAGVRRGRRGHRRPDRARGRRAAARARRRAARSSASPTCRRSPRWPTATSRSSRTPRPSPRRRRSPGSSAATVVGELVRMLGAEDGDAAARRHAQELLKAA